MILGCSWMNFRYFPNRGSASIGFSWYFKRVCHRNRHKPWPGIWVTAPATAVATFWSHTKETSILSDFGTFICAPDFRPFESRFSLHNDISDPRRGGRLAEMIEMIEMIVEMIDDLKKKVVDHLEMIEMIDPWPAHKRNPHFYWFWHFWHFDLCSRYSPLWKSIFTTQRHLRSTTRRAAGGDDQWCPLVDPDFHYTAIFVSCSIFHRVCVPLLFLFSFPFVSFPFSFVYVLFSIV